MKRYIQQIAVKEIGKQGQEKIAAAKVLIIGAGGLGVPSATYLSGMGVGTIGIVDGDTIALTNLHRQFLYNPYDIGKNKAEVLSEKLSDQNPEIKIVSYPFNININNATELIGDYDIVCDCSDNVDTRILADEICSQLNKPLLYTAVKEWEGYITILNNKSKLRLTDLFSAGQLQEGSINNCSFAGIVNTVCGTMASLQANEVLKIILDSPFLIDGEILCVNLFSNTFRKLKLKVRKKDSLPVELMNLQG